MIILIAFIGILYMVSLSITYNVPGWLIIGIPILGLIIYVCYNLAENDVEEENRKMKVTFNKLRGINDYADRTEK
jgi:hypothetical protein